jgi:N4-gp56 family major capsid protein
MAATTVPSGSNIAQTAWRPGLVHEVERQAHMLGFVSSEDDAAILLIEDLSKKRGDSVQVRFAPTDDTHDGFTENETAEGFEQKITFYPDNLKIGYLREVFAQQEAMSQQRVNFDLKKAAFIKASAWWARRFELSILNQLAGYTPAMGAAPSTNYRRTGMNAVTAVDATHVYRPNSIANDESFTNVAANYMTLATINHLVLMAMTKAELTYPIAPCSDGFYHLVMHPYQWEQLRNSTSTGEFSDITKAAMTGSFADAKQKFERGWLGVWNNVKLHVSDYVPNGVNSGDSTALVATCRRAVFLGAMAAVVAFGEGYTDGQHLDWIEQTRDYGTTWGVQADSVFGVKRTIFNSQTYGCLVVPTYSKA